MANRSPQVEVINISKQYESVGGADAGFVLKDLSLEVNAGDSLAVVGPSGSGKSTLLNIIGTLDKPTSGDVRLEGTDLLKLEASELAELRNGKIGFIFQAHHLLPQLTVLENVLIPTIATGDSDSAAEERARELIEEVGLQDRMSHRPGQLSGGERQRVAVVRALINQPKLLLADEPTGALDHRTAGSLIDLLVKLNETKGVTLIMVTHALDLAARMNRLYELEEGALVAQESSSGSAKSR